MQSKTLQTNKTKSDSRCPSLLTTACKDNAGKTNSSSQASSSSDMDLNTSKHQLKMTSENNQQQVVKLSSIARHISLCWHSKQNVMLTLISQVKLKISVSQFL